MAHTILPTRPLTYEAYCQLPEDGQRYEFLGGEVYVSPALSMYHHYTLLRVALLLNHFFDQQRSEYQLFVAPFDMILVDDQIVHADAEMAQPDVCVARLDRLSKRGLEGAAFLIVEVISPSRPWLDRDVKTGRYAAHGVRHYWIADPENEQLDCFLLTDEKYVMEASGRGKDVVTVPSFPSLCIDLASLWFSTRSGARSEP